MKTGTLRRVKRVERDFMLFLPHEVIGFLIAFLTADDISEGSPLIIERIVRRKIERAADAAGIELNSKFFAMKKLQLHDAYSC